ncbi:MAG: threonylcarbamoyl-AMP synthase [Bacteroidales bacterium]|nr:threonylcarbamoyl-AMP synthase [Bacteroidales bacterium]
MHELSMKLEIRNCIDVLRKGGTILYPTDTIWGIGCDATNTKAVQKVFKIKKRMESKSLIVLLDRKESLHTYISSVPDIALDLVDSVTTPLTIIYPNAKNLAKNIIANDGTIAIRLVRHEFCYKLIRMFGKPIVSTSANISGQPSPLMFKSITEEIISQVDYVVNLSRFEVKETKPSTIIRLKTNGEFEIIRK